jgi:hypothetical protein
MKFYWSSELEGPVLMFCRLNLTTEYCCKCCKTRTSDCVAHGPQVMKVLVKFRKELFLSSSQKIHAYSSRSCRHSVSNLGVDYVMTCLYPVRASCRAFGRYHCVRSPPAGKALLSDFHPTTELPTSISPTYKTSS